MLGFLITFYPICLERIGHTFHMLGPPMTQSLIAFWHAYGVCTSPVGVQRDRYVYSRMLEAVVEMDLDFPEHFPRALVR